jgi:hypothetical protein
MPVIEEIKVSGENLVKTIENLIHEGNVRHVVLKTLDGHTLIEFPVTVGVIGFVLAPIVAAVAALAAIVSHVTVVVTRGDEPPPV